MSKILSLLCLALLSSFASAKDWQIQMLNYGDAGSMVFEPSYVHAQVGDTVTFVPTQSGHNAKSYVVPEQAKQWTSPLNETYTLPLSQEGIHLYYCPPHLMMGMIGVIQVGNASNIDVIEQKYSRLRSKIALSPERADAIVAQIKN
ncbi:pseudoazurin [Marinomonas communis]|uniref:pseudoazurin n=1 Tax=Marinomonas communis TaxID=28254 RepID=UPI001D18A084|nr:pseudoazurin [Marinomonas communis]MCC4273197.1 pseudoazurin [Marinomonas communis]